MKDSDIDKIIELAFVGGGWIPANDKAHDLADISKNGEVHMFLEVTARDLKFHKCYFSLLGYIWEYLPKSFKQAIPKEKFYIFVKHIKGDYKTLFKFKDGSEWNEYESISFGNKSQKQFEAYIRDQMPFIYNNILALYYEGDIYNSIIANIEQEYVKFLSKL